MSKLSKKNIKVKKKKSKGIPKGIILFSVFFFILPFIKYLFYSFQYEIPLLKPFIFMDKLDIATFILIFIPFFVAIGLILIQKWGLYLLLSYIALFIILNFYKAMINPNKYNFATIAFVQFYFVALFYFIRDQRRKPYLDKDFRGFRENERIPLDIDILVNTEKFTTLEMSAGGALIQWEGCKLQKNQEIDVSFTLFKEQFNLKAGIAWITEAQVGIAFRGLDEKFKKNLNRALVSYY